MRIEVLYVFPFYNNKFCCCLKFLERKIITYYHLWGTINEYPVMHTVPIQHDDRTVRGKTLGLTKTKKKTATKISKIPSGGRYYVLLFMTFFSLRFAFFLCRYILSLFVSRISIPMKQYNIFTLPRVQGLDGNAFCLYYRCCYRRFFPLG